MEHQMTKLFDHDEITKRISEMAAQITEDYRGKVTEENPALILCTLRGAVFFSADLVRQIKIPCELDFVKVHSYCGTRPADVPVFDLGESINVAGRHVLIVEDIVDTGHTMDTMLKRFSGQNAASVRVCTLLDKPSRREVPGIIPDYTGFSIDDLFVIGWGLDYNEKYRLLRDIMVYHPTETEQETLRR